MSVWCEWRREEVLDDWFGAFFPLLSCAHTQHVSFPIFYFFNTFISNASFFSLLAHKMDWWCCIGESFGSIVQCVWYAEKIQQGISYNEWLVVLLAQRLCVFSFSALWTKPISSTAGARIWTWIHLDRVGVGDDLFGFFCLVILLGLFNPNVFSICLNHKVIGSVFPRLGKFLRSRSWKKIEIRKKIWTVIIIIANVVLSERAEIVA